MTKTILNTSIKQWTNMEIEIFDINTKKLSAKQKLLLTSSLRKYLRCLI